VTEKSPAATVAPTAPHHGSKVRFLDAAMHVIRAQGYSRTTIDDVCEAAGRTKGSFFHHFDTKEELALAAADHFAAMADRAFAAAPCRRRTSSRGGCRGATR